MYKKLIDPMFIKFKFCTFLQSLNEYKKIYGVILMAFQQQIKHSI